MAAATEQDMWDVALLAVHPTHGMPTELTAPYVLIDGTSAVPQGSKLGSIEAVDRPRTHIGVAANRVYDLFLSRTLWPAELVRFANGADA